MCGEEKKLFILSEHPTQQSPDSITHTFFQFFLIIIFFPIISPFFYILLMLHLKWMKLKSILIVFALAYNSAIFCIRFCHKFIFLLAYTHSKYKIEPSTFYILQHTKKLLRDIYRWMLENNIKTLEKNDFFDIEKFVTFDNNSPTSPIYHIHNKNPWISSSSSSHPYPQSTKLATCNTIKNFLSHVLPESTSYLRVFVIIIAPPSFISHEISIHPLFFFQAYIVYGIKYNIYLISCNIAIYMKTYIYHVGCMLLARCPWRKKIIFWYYFFPSFLFYFNFHRILKCIHGFFLHTWVHEENGKNNF